MRRMVKRLLRAVGWRDAANTTNLVQRLRVQD